MVADIISWICIVSGGFLLVTGAFGIIRFPDFFTRMHAASVTDTLASMLIIFGMLLQSGTDWLVSVKLVLIVLFILITSPTAGHALAKAALHAGMSPWQKTADKESEQQDTNSGTAPKE